MWQQNTKSLMQTMTVPKMMTRVSMTASTKKFIFGPPPVRSDAGPTSLQDWKGKHLTDSLHFDGKACPPLASEGLGKTTMVGHRRILRMLADNMDIDLREVQLDRAIIETINRQRRRRKWMWSTTTTKLASIQGALANLPVYGTIAGSNQPIFLKFSVPYKMALKTAAKRAREQQGKQPKAAQPEHISHVLGNATIPSSTRCAVLIAWLSAARVGDTLQLRKHDVTLTGNQMHITWMKGKTIARRGPYSITTIVPDNHRDLLMQQFNSTTSNLFPHTTGRQIKLALRTADPQLEQRSIRRGSLQALAQAGMSEEKLLLFSGHGSVKMLLRYLGYGRHAKYQQQTMLHAAAMTFETLA